MVQATLEVYKQTVSGFLPTPTKSHYVFNLRDFSRVIRGVLLVPHTRMHENDKLIRLWVHEVYRVFYDRLIDEKDRSESWVHKGMFSNDENNTDIVKCFWHFLPHFTTNNGLFQLPESGSNSDSDSGSKPYGYIVLFRTFSIAWKSVLGMEICP